MTPFRSYARLAAVTLGGLLIGWLVLAITADRVFANAAPTAALFWNPGSADANTRLADYQLQQSPSAIRSPELRSRALAALGRQPVGPKAARLLALAAAADGQPARADRLIAYAEAMSRRDLPTEFFLIERNVTRNDVAGALVHYDRAMRTTSSSWPTLFPILAQAAQQPAIWQPLLPLLASRPPWARPFLQTYVPQATSPAALVAVARRLRLDRSPSPDEGMLQAIEQRLITLAAFRPAAMLYDRAHDVPAGDAPLLRNGGFEQPGGGSPFDWNLTDEVDLSATRQPNPTGKGQALFITGANGRGGEVAKQLLMLPPGSYRLSAQVGAVAGDRLTFPQLIVRCMTDGHEIFHQPFPAAPANGAIWKADVTVPAGCPAEQIVIQARSPLDTQDTVPWIDAITLEPRGGR